MIRIIVLLILVLAIFFILLNIRKIKKKLSFKHLILLAVFFIILLILFIVLPRLGINPIAGFQALIGKIIPILGMLRSFFIS